MPRNRQLTPVVSIAILVLAPLALGAKGGCTHAVVGDEGSCKTNCGEAGSDDGAGGSAGSKGGGAGLGGASAGHGNGGISGQNATGGGPAKGGSAGQNATGGGRAKGGSGGVSGQNATGGGPAKGGSGGMGGGTVCGGLRGSSCTSGQFCDFPPDALCGRADATGLCATVPEVCDTLYAPVCGCDGMTYSNGCDANMHGVSVEGDGACSSPPDGQVCGGLTGATCPAGEYCDFPLSPSCVDDQTGTCQAMPAACTKEYVPVCGCDATTYGNACEAHAAGVAIATTGECGAPPATCGGIAALACPDGQYCDFPLATQCGSGDQSGTCALMPDGCTDQYDPVCGCDGKTYSTACEAARAGISVSATGACTQ